MDDLSVGELVALHLSRVEADGPASDGSVSFKQTTEGIVIALDTHDSISGRIELLTTLVSMKEAGLLLEHRGSLEGLAGQRNYYQLTEEGRELARSVSRRVEDETIDVVDDGETTQVRLDAIDEELPDMNLGEALARTTDTGVLHRREEVNTHEGIVGRRSEIETLLDCIGAVHAGAIETVLVAGESGIGKTTLVEQALEGARDRDFEVLAGTATEDATQPYQAVRAALAEHRAAVPDRLFEADTAAEDIDVADLEDLADRRRSLFYDVGEGLADLAAAQPVALFLDDLHAADPGTLALLEYLASSLDDAGVLLVGAYRPEELVDGHPLQSLVTDVGNDVVTLDLGPFEEPSTRTLIERTLGAHGVPGAFVDRVHDRTGGHPLFVEATVRHLREQGVVDPDAGHYPDDPDLPLPEAVRTAIERRLDVLDDTARDVLDAASVIGTTIDFRVLAAVADLHEVDLREYVDLLVAARVWIRGSDPADEAGSEAAVATDGGQLLFANEVVRDAVRERLPDRTRRQLHEQVAEALERVHANEREDHAGTIARHYDRAGDPEAAIEHYRLAGEHAASVYAHETAVDTYERALALAREHDRGEELRSLLVALGTVYFHSGDPESAERYFRFVRERTDDPAILREIATSRVLIHLDRGEYDAAIELADEMLAAWDGTSASPEVCQLLHGKTWALIRTGQLADARSLVDTQLEMADDLDDDEMRAMLLNDLGIVHKQQGDLEEAATAHRRAIDIARAHEPRLDLKLAANLNNLASVYRIQGDLEAARERFEQSREYARELGNKVREMPPTCAVGVIRWRLGEREEARELLEECVDTCRKIDQRAILSFSLMTLGRMDTERGELRSARASLEEGLEVSEDIGYNIAAAESRFGLARLERLEGTPEVALEHVETGLETVEGVDEEVLARAYRLRGTVLRTMDRVGDAIESYETGLKTAEACENHEELIRSRCGLAVASVRTGRHDRALEQAEAAREAAVESAYPLLSVEVEVAVGRVQRTRDDHEAATEALEAALEDARDLDVTRYECEVLYERGRLHRSRESPGAARDAFERAMALAEEMGATLYERRCEDALARLSDDGDA